MAKSRHASASWYLIQIPAFAGMTKTGDTMSNVAQQVRDLIEPSITSMGFNLVQVKLNDGKHRLLQIMAERPD
ncbi:MAG: hypothetical protein ACOYJ2_08850, partial [Rickettsiales bacterium]